MIEILLQVTLLWSTVPTLLWPPGRGIMMWTRVGLMLTLVYTRLRWFALVELRLLATFAARPLETTIATPSCLPMVLSSFATFERAKAELLTMVTDGHMFVLVVFPVTATEVFTLM